MCRTLSTRLYIIGVTELIDQVIATRGLDSAKPLQVTTTTDGAHLVCYRNSTNCSDGPQNTRGCGQHLVAFIILCACVRVHSCDRRRSRLCTRTYNKPGARHAYSCCSSHCKPYSALLLCGLFIALPQGGFTPLGLTLIQNLAQRGAHIIALSPKPVDHPEVEILIELLRSTTKNDHIYAEECDLSSSASVRSFCTGFITGKDTRLDAIVFAHEYQPIGSLLTPDDLVELAKRRRAASLATFLMITLLLPVLLVAPVERDIRIINVINPFYAAASMTYSVAEALPPTAPLFKQEGRRSLETILFMRHLQRVLDALPSGGQVPKTDETSVRVVSDKVQKSNIVAVSVCPGMSRADTIATLLKASGTQARRSILGTVMQVLFEFDSLAVLTVRFSYVIAQPLLRLLTKSQTATVQSILHVLFLPTPFKSTQTPGTTTTPGDTPEEVLKAGALYRECAVARVRIPTSDGIPLASDGQKDESIPDDRELGGVHLGQSVWESFEVALKEWEKTVGASDREVVGDDTPSVDTPWYDRCLGRCTCIDQSDRFHRLNVDFCSRYDPGHPYDSVAKLISSPNNLLISKRQSVGKYNKVIP